MPDAKIIDGAAIAARTREEVKTRVAEILRHGRAVHLAAILVGSTPAGELYEVSIEEEAQEGLQRESDRQTDR